MKNVSLPVRYFMAEFYGTFLMIFLGVGVFSIIGNYLSIAVIVGATYLFSAYTLDHISHAHFNPVITLAAWIDQRLNLKTALIYWGAQLGGAVFGYISLQLFNVQGFFTRDIIFSARDLGILAFMGYILVYVYLAVSENQEKRPFLGLAVGVTYMVLTLLTISSTYGILIPLRALEMTSLGSMLTMTLALAFGSALATLFYKYLAYKPTKYQTHA